MKRVIILIDGQNLYYALRSIGCLEKEVSWTELFKSFLVADDELIRTYWFRPQRILDTYFTTANIKYQIINRKFNSYCKQFLADPKSLPPEIEAKVVEEIKKVEDWLRTEKTKFAQIEYNYDQLALEFDDIEIVKTGIVKVNPFLQEYVGEKGVDISLAVRMISLSVEKRCDKIVLISGDYDYAEAIRFVKNNMTKIHIVKIHKGYPPKNRNVSRDLAILADKVIDIYESEIKSSFKR